MSDINITNNFNAPIGQHIDHVDTVNLQMDGDGQFHFGMVEKVNQNANENQNENQNINNNQNASDDELFHFIHPSVNEQEEMIIHNEVKRLVTKHGIQEICQYLYKMSSQEKILLPQNPGVAYKELTRIGMPDGDGFTLKTFQKYYKR